MFKEGGGHEIVGKKIKKKKTIKKRKEGRASKFRWGDNFLKGKCNAFYLPPPFLVFFLTPDQIKSSILTYMSTIMKYVFFIFCASSGDRTGVKQVTVCFV